jgi:hypothetical protein
MKNALRLAVLAVGLGLPPSSDAGTVAPSKPSDLRTLVGIFGGGTPCPGSPALRAVDRQQNPNGTTSAFSIPAGRVFVVTSFDVQAANAPGTTAEIDLFVSNGTGDASFMARCGGLAGNNGSAVAACTIPPGVAVKAGSTLCFLGANSVTVHGFIAKDK